MALVVASVAGISGGTSTCAGAGMAQTGGVAFGTMSSLGGVAVVAAGFGGMLLVKKQIEKSEKEMEMEMEKKEGKEEDQGEEVREEERGKRERTRGMRRMRRKKER
eukprot:gnl/MRDRNA2_/MRDRNA2_82200_c0_seq1.p2 gnl/MRDRNA2_/MRDRNA2_82200_c0~~gnl/MRDRNA2_/MRDRNA2_82200_c0_seq1.p2  ORF type:complete len:106 (-),score=35.56 gnl/MRDRNA2_/MRDRNA2_82200_c0_seq1:325-642(-)